MRVAGMVGVLVLIGGVALGADVQIGAGGQLILGGFDPATKRDADLSTGAASLEQAMANFKKAGATSHEVYVRWNLCEPAPGHWDFHVYDRYVAVYKEYRLKWVPFLICGSPYSLPDWYYKKAGAQGYICLEHGQESDVQSLWNPALRPHVARFIKAFCDHYRDSGTIEAILLGVTGNYGEAIYPATGNDWTADYHGQYHTHAGFWAGDPYAVECFHAWVMNKYRTDAKLGEAWGDDTLLLNHVRPFLRKDAPGKGGRAWLDMVDWYQASMTEWSDFWLSETRKNFKGDIYLCTGGNAIPAHGSDFGVQCKIAAKVGAGVRITNEASDYGLNFTYTRWVASAGRQYGAYYSFEPAGPVDEKGVVARVYNATASGARGLHYYYPNIFRSPAAVENFLRSGAQFQQRKPIVEIGVYYPTTAIKLAEKPGEYVNRFFKSSKSLRDRFDYDYISDNMIADGSLKPVKALLLVQSESLEKAIWEAICGWVQAGGLLVYPKGIGELRSVEGDELKFPEPGKGAILSIDADGKSLEFYDFAAAVLAKAPQLSPLTRAMVAGDGKEDGRFVTLIAPDELLWYDAAKAEISSTKAVATAGRTN